MRPVLFLGLGLLMGYAVSQMAGATIDLTQSYNEGYREGMLYAYDNVVVCGASPEAEGLRLAQIMGKTTVSSISCEE